MSRDVIAALDWNAIEDAVNIVTAGRAKRIDGEGWKVYQMGTIVRIDISLNHEV
jgi:hypothetical protein